MSPTARRWLHRLLGIVAAAGLLAGLIAGQHQWIRVAVLLSLPAAAMAYLGEDVDTAASTVIGTTLTEAGGTGGIIVLDAQGNASMPFNTEGMYRGAITRSGVVTTLIYGDEE